MILCLALFAGCSPTFTTVSNNVKNYSVSTYILKSGESISFDVKDIFKDSGLNIKNYDILVEKDSQFTALKNTVTATSTGISYISVALYPRGSSAIYYASLGRLYSYDEQDFTEIRTVEELCKMKDANKGYYILKSDLDLSGIENWQPIGSFFGDGPFTGMFINPEGHVIRNLSIRTASALPIGPYGGCEGGLFGHIEDTLLYGLKLENVFIDLLDYDQKGFAYAGGITADTYHEVYIKDCSVQGTIRSKAETGGIAGATYGTIEGCSFSGEIVGCNQGKDDWLEAQSAGGIIGTYKYRDLGDFPLKESIKSCSASGIVKNGRCVGGIAGYVINKSTVTDCSFQGSYDENASYSGEIIGYAREDDYPPIE